MEADKDQELNSQEVPMQGPEDVSETDTRTFSTYGR
jgi:hypothetical protein